MNNYYYHLHFEEVERRLRQWGKWYNYIISLGLGHPSTSITGLLIEQKGVLISSTVKAELPENEKAEEIEVLVHELRKINQSHASILKYHYIEDEDVELKIKKISISRRTYFRHLKEAKEWISNKIT